MTQAGLIGEGLLGAFQYALRGVPAAACWRCTAWRGGAAAPTCPYGTRPGSRSGRRPSSPRPADIQGHRNPHMCYELITHWCSSSTPTNCGFSSFQGVKLISSHNPFLNIYPIETSHVVPDVWTDRSSYMPPLSAVPPGRLFEVNASEWLPYNYLDFGSSYEQTDVLVLLAGQHTHGLVPVLDLHTVDLDAQTHRAMRSALHHSLASQHLQARLYEAAGGTSPGWFYLLLSFCHPLRQCCWGQSVVNREMQETRELPTEYTHKSESRFTSKTWWQSSSDLAGFQCRHSAVSPQKCIVWFLDPRVQTDDFVA